MSNHLAAAAVTAALKEVLQEAVGTPPVKVGRPAGGTDQEEGVNLFLYQATPNAALRNMHQPSVRATGMRSGPSVVALNLHYLISFVGPSESFAPERLLGLVARALEHPGHIPRAKIQKVIDEQATLNDADLQFAPEAVHINPASLSLDELSKLWSVLFQIPYTLSVAYTCSPVLIESRESGSSGQPVTSVGITALVLGGPTLFAVMAEAGPGFPILWGGNIVISGQGLGRSDLRLRFDGQLSNLAAAARSSDRIVLPLTLATFPAGPLRAGPVTIEAVVPAPPGAPAHLERVSDRTTFVLRPLVTLGANPVSGDKLTATISPVLHAGQQASLLLDEQSIDKPVSYRVGHEPIDAADYPVSELVYSVDDLKPAEYYVQILVDGTASAPHVNLTPGSTYGQITGPRVTLP